jgi:hypothetical protein
MAKEFEQFIFVSARLWRWFPLNFWHKARPRYLQALTALFRAIAPAVVGFQSWAFLRGGMMAAAPRLAITLWHLRVPLSFTRSYDPICVNQQMQRASSTTVWEGDFERLLATAKGTEVRHFPVEPCQTQQAFHETDSLRSGMPNSTFSVKQTWIVASLNSGWRPRLSVGRACQGISE